MNFVCISLQTYKNDFFNSINEGLHFSVEFRQNMMFGCLSSLLTWAKSKQQTLKSTMSSQPPHNRIGMPSLSETVHSVIRKLAHMVAVSAVEKYK